MRAMRTSFFGYEKSKVRPARMRFAFSGRVGARMREGGPPRLTGAADYIDAVRRGVRRDRRRATRRGWWKAESSAKAREEPATRRAGALDSAPAAAERPPVTVPKSRDGAAWR